MGIQIYTHKQLHLLAQHAIVHIDSNEICNKVRESNVKSGKERFLLIKTKLKRHVNVYVCISR